ncbi:Ku protein [Marilutibacter aestuarii]|uniref:Non-homologous end joining protein Ku n=1 Tax=Marilutibacter aestuarii TaxID=1706195 RepID=A0A508AGN6_9GAMM|nr:Ku protein [Lysobacter aestuarii]TQD46325.1 Ku protein [Lysobacter aestuarii]
MARPIWTGTLSFGLLNIPVSLMSGERRTDLQFRMLDARSKTPIRYERVNAETGEEVPWKDIVKAFEYDKGSYVVIEKEDIASAAPDSHETVEVEAFVDAGDIPLQYFEKPYVLVPAKKAEKGYVLLRETLKETGQVGVARVVIRTRGYLCAVVPQGDALLLLLLRYPQELVDPADYRLPAGKTGEYRISDKEFDMARQLIKSMSGKWAPDDYHDEFREQLQDVIRRKMKSKGAKAKIEESEHELDEDATTNVVDFMALLKKSIDSQKRTPAKKAAAKKAASRKSEPAPKKSAAKKKPAAKKSRSKSTRKKAGKASASSAKDTRKAG